LTRRRKGKPGLSRTWRFIADALSGRLGVFLMTLSYTVIAIVLLAYVSTQVYTSSLQEEIARRRNTVRDVEEQTAVLMGEYRAVTSRDRIMTYCRKHLGMVEAGPLTVTRVRIKGDANRTNTGEPGAADRGQTAEGPKGAFDGLTEVLRR